MLFVCYCQMQGHSSCDDTQTEGFLLSSHLSLPHKVAQRLHVYKNNSWRSSSTQVCSTTSPSLIESLQHLHTKHDTSSSCSHHLPERSIYTLITTMLRRGREKKKKALRLLLSMHGHCQARHHLIPEIHRLKAFFSPPIFHYYLKQPRPYMSTRTRA